MAMFIRPCYRRKNGKRHAYWALVESCRTGKGPRRRVVGYLGEMPEKMRRGVKHAAEGNPPAKGGGLFPDEEPDAEWAETDAKEVRVENPRGFGGPWLAMHLLKLPGLDNFLADALPGGDEAVAWNLTSLILMICRLLNPSSELHMAGHFYKSTALP
ncbi:MAG: hypothetical protein LBE84_09325, partial [Planctomycetota bacterium]|nr:hypothetical protein [Planctomycetota bacterium]